MSMVGVLSSDNDFPIRTDEPVHSGKVRSVYWLTKADSKRLIKEKGYNISPDAPLAVMVISDRISAFECLWRGENGVCGIPGKGAALNAISNHWFKLFAANGLADSHIVDVPHPLVWIVQKAKPIKIEAIARGYLTGSMWRAYKKGDRSFCGIELPDGLAQDGALPEVLITPSTKGILKGLVGVAEVDDVNVSRDDLVRHYEAFNFSSIEDIKHYEQCLMEGFELIRDRLASLGQIFVDTKFEFGYVYDMAGNEKLIYMDEVGTPDSSRIWDAKQYQQGVVVENSKEGFRQLLLNNVPDPDVLTNKDRMAERIQLSERWFLPDAVTQEISATYLSIAEAITGEKVSVSDDPRADIINLLKTQYQLIN